jgi:predicted secreted protein
VVAGGLLMLGLAGLLQALFSQSASVPVSCGSTVALKAGDSEELRFTARAGAGFRWEGAVTGGANTVSLDGGTSLTGNMNTAEGVKADQVFSLRGLSKGEGSVRFLHVQPFDRRQPIGDCTIKFKVD